MTIQGFNPHANLIGDAGVTTAQKGGVIAAVDTSVIPRVLTAKPTGATNALAVAVFDASGNQITNFGGGGTAATATLSNVSGSASSVTLLSSNSARIGASIANDSTAALYVKFGTTASTTSYTIKLLQDDYYEVPYGYTGRIDGIWASATGAARVTEITA